MPIYEICNFDDIRFVSYCMWEERLKELIKDLLKSLSYWTEEICTTINDSFLIKNCLISCLLYF